MAERNITDYITYDASTNRYTRIINDLYNYYKGIAKPIGLATLITHASCGFLSKEDFIDENGKQDMKKLTQFSKNVLQLWSTDMSPEPYMRKYPTFEKAAHAYAEDMGIASSVNAYLSGVPIDDLLA